MKLSSKSEYALLALIELAQRYDTNIPCTIATIAEQRKIPKKFLEQILLSLKRAGFVKSRKGPEGGVWLARDPAEICVADILRLMDGALAPVESVSRYFYEPTPIEQCPALLDVFKDIRDYISDKLEKTTLAQLVT